jgi:hypothetical protein
MAQLSQAELQKYRVDGDVIFDLQLARTKVNAHRQSFLHHYRNESS